MEFPIDFHLRGLRLQLIGSFGEEHHGLHTQLDRLWSFREGCLVRDFSMGFSIGILLVLFGI